MSVYSIDHNDDEVSDKGYKGYHIDKQGEVTEFYDHRNEEGAPSSCREVSHHQPLIASNGYKTPAIHSERTAPVVRVRNDAGCCNSCVSLLTSIGTLPLGTAFAVICCWAGTAMFIGGGWTALDESMELFKDAGPNAGNPYSDPPPEYLALPGPVYVLLNKNDLGNRVPQVVAAIKYSFYGIIPFMLIFVLALAIDSQYSRGSLKHHRLNCKASDSGIGVTGFLIGCCVVGVIFWIIWLCFVTLGIYYYRVTMQRCSDLDDREYSLGVMKNICIDLVQIGLVMFQSTTDEGFGKICGPDNAPRPNFGDLEQYCERYFPIYRNMLITYSGCFLIIIGLIVFIIILTSNYTALIHEVNDQIRSKAMTVASSAAPSTAVGYYGPDMPQSLPPSSIYTAPSPYIRGTRDPVAGRRSSKDIELDYILDSESNTTAPVKRRRDMDSNVGVNYYYKDRPRY